MVNATLEVVEENIGPLYLKLFASHTWKHWYQASTVDVETSRFRVTPAKGGGHGKRIGQVEAWACIEQPDFLYLIGCVTEGYSPGKKLGTQGAAPPFADCVSVAGICGATCDSGVYEPTYYDPTAPGYHKTHAMHCVDPLKTPGPQLPLGHFAPGDFDSYPRASPPFGLVGAVRLDDIEAVEEASLGMRPASYLFSVMYVMGVLSLFLMYVPAIGQKEGEQPSWARLKATLLKGSVGLSNRYNDREMRLVSGRRGSAAEIRPCASHDDTISETTAGGGGLGGNGHGGNGQAATATATAAPRSSAAATAAATACGSAGLGGRCRRACCRAASTTGRPARC